MLTYDPVRWMTDLADALYFAFYCAAEVTYAMWDDPAYAIPGLDRWGLPPC